LRSSKSICSAGHDLQSRKRKKVKKEVEKFYSNSIGEEKPMSGFCERRI
jgi:hypothetical protein